LVPKLQPVILSLDTTCPSSPFTVNGPYFHSPTPLQQRFFLGLLSNLSALIHTPPPFTGKRVPLWSHFMYNIIFSPKHYPFSVTLHALPAPVTNFQSVHFFTAAFLPGSLAGYLSIPPCAQAANLSPFPQTSPVHLD
jgi:hypothetical protein